MSTLRIEHIEGEGEGEPQFRVVRVKDGKAAAPAAVRPPIGYPVEGRPNSDLLRELRWYLEEFLGYPFPPETDHAERILAALRKWGREAFDVLFNDRQSAVFLHDAQEGGRYDKLNLQIASDDPRVLSWPWEALEDSQSGLLAQTCQIERRLNQVVDPSPLDPRLPRDRVNILLVTARPFEGDVRYRSISRPVVDLIAKNKLPAHVTVLRPPTFDQLRRHLAEHPHTYHVLHFDGHGGYAASAAPQGSGPFMLNASGVLVFEGDDGKPNPISSAQLSNLLREHAVPAVVLSACQSAMVDEHAADPFASVAAGLLKSGTRSVVAMAYSLYVSGAREFVPAFYERLFTSGDTAQAVRAGRQQMFAQKGRICARGEFPLEDWLVPVVYQQDPLDFSFAATAKQAAIPAESKLPTEARDAENPYGFIGRDGPLLALERALRRPPTGILIQGLGGIGKTTLARGFVEWLETTGGIGAGCLWFTFVDIRSAEFVVNRIGESLFGTQFAAAGMDDKLDALAAKLRDHRVIIVWDNFEVARGIPGTSVTANLTDDDRAILLKFLKKLRGGKTKVLITSRSPDEWLGHENCFTLPIGGLDGDERWEYCEAVLRDLGLSPNRDDPKMIELMDLLDGHPLAMRAILPKLAELSPSVIAEALRTNLDALDLPESDVSKKLAATLRFVQDSLPADQRPLLVLLSLHEGFVDSDYLELMAQQVDASLTRLVIDRFTHALVAAGLLRDRGQSIFELHPALTGYLRARVTREVDPPARDAWARAFVDLMGSFADALAPKELHEQRGNFHIHATNFYHALAEAERLGMDAHQKALSQSLAMYAQNTRDFAGAARLFAQLSEACKGAGDQEGEAAAYHQLGQIAREQRNFAGADQWYRKSLAINENQGNERWAARTYHELGIIAEVQRDFVAADEWYRKALPIMEKHGDEQGAATTNRQLGSIADEQRDFAAAEGWYLKSLAIEEKLGNEHGAGVTYHQLGIIAEEQRDFVAAERWYRKSLTIEEKQGNEHEAAMTYHHLGRIAQEQRDFAAAEQWCRKSLAIKEKQGNEHGAAITYHQLGRIAEEQRDFAAAEQWYRKSLAIKEKQGNEHGAASTYHQLGSIAQEQRDFAGAEKLYRKSLAIEERQGNDHGAATTYGQLGILAALQSQFDHAGRWLIKCHQAFARCNHPHGTQQAALTFALFHKHAPSDVQAKLAEIWREAGLGELPPSPQDNAA